MNLDQKTVFDYKAHRENFINYLEVVILKDGSIEYAIPSHQWKLAKIYCENHDISYKELINMIPVTDEPISWIVYTEGVISVWYDSIIMPEVITKEQQEALDKLKEEKCISENYISYIVFRNEYGNLSKRIGD